MSIVECKKCHSTIVTPITVPDKSDYICEGCLMKKEKVTKRFYTWINLFGDLKKYNTNSMDFKIGYEQAISDVYDRIKNPTRKKK